MSKYLSDEDKKRLLEGLKMADIITMLINEREVEKAKKMLADNEPIEKIAKFTDLDMETIKALQEQLEQEENDSDNL
jgi:hypothetical protein